jgi:hypothetical protein
VNGAGLRDALLDASQSDSWVSGFVEALFAVGEKLNLLFQPRMQAAWDRVGIPPGPWVNPSL